MIDCWDHMALLSSRDNPGCGLCENFRDIRAKMELMNKMKSMNSLMPSVSEADIYKDPAIPPPSDPPQPWGNSSMMADAAAGKEARS